MDFMPLQSFLVRLPLSPKAAIAHSRAAFANTDVDGKIFVFLENTRSLFQNDIDSTVKWPMFLKRPYNVAKPCTIV